MGKMIIFGDINRFAVGMEILGEDDGDGFTPGINCYYVGARQVGTTDIAVWMEDLQQEYTGIVGNKAHRRNPYLMSLPANDLIFNLSTALYGSDCEDWERYHIRAEAEGWYRMDISPGNMAFRSLWVYLVEDETVGTIVYTGLDYTPVYEFVVQAGEVDRVLQQAIEYLNEALKVDVEAL